MTLRKRIYNYFKGCREWGKWEAKGLFKRETGIVDVFFIKSPLKRLTGIRALAKASGT